MASDNRIKNIDFLYLVALIIYIFRELYVSSQYYVGGIDPPFFRYLYFVSITSLLITVILLDNRYSNTILLIIVSAVFLLTLLSAGKLRELIMVALFIVAAENVNLERVFLISAIFMAAYISVVIILDLVGAFSEYALYFENVDRMTEDGIVSRSFLGFDYPTKVPNYYMSIVLMLAFSLRKKRRNLLLVVLGLIINYALYRVTNTRAIYYEVILFIIVAYMIKFFKETCNYNVDNSILIKLLSIVSWPIYLGVSLYLGLKYDSDVEWMKELNKVLSRRLQLTRDAISEYGIHMFGSDFEWRAVGYRGTDNYLFVDCSFWNIIIRYGVVMLVLVMALYMVLMIDSIRTKDAIFTWILVVVGLHSCTDPQLISVVYTPFILIAFGVIKKSFEHRDMLVYQKRNLWIKIQTK